MASDSAAAPWIVLLLTPDRDLATAVADALDDGRPERFALETCADLPAGLERLAHPGIALVLYVPWPGMPALDGIAHLGWAAHHVPFVVLADDDDQGFTAEAIERGAADVLPVRHLDRHLLPRTLRYVLDRHAARQRAFEQEERAIVTLGSIDDAVISAEIGIGADGAEGIRVVADLNHAAEHLTGWTRAEAAGRPTADVVRIVDTVTRASAADPLERCVRLDAPVSLPGGSLLVSRDGSESAVEGSAAPIHDLSGRIVGGTLVLRDVSAVRVMAEQIAHLAQHDSLTDLPNRVLLNDRLVQAIGLARRRGARLAVLFVDVDRFKHVNDSMGHLVGDRLLRSIARRLVASVRASDTVSRHGGDEFVILLSEIDRPADAATSARKIMASLTAPFDISAQDVHVTASIGIALYPDDGVDAETLIGRADTAMYHAKTNGRNGCQFFDAGMHAPAVARRWVETGLRGALSRGEFVLHYQPKMDLATGAMTGAEALIRWTHPDRGLVSPTEFIQVAEDSGLIVPIGRWVLGEACRQARAWIDRGLRATPVSVNISALEFRQQDFLAHVRAVLDESRLEPRLLELELTEGVLMQHTESTLAVLHALKRIGVQIAIDDFGTGYSSLSYLRQFPIDVLKVDQSFVHEITGDPGATPIVSAVISMGRGLNQRVIAEGVETKRQLAFLQAQGCGEGQGYYFSRPVVAGDFARLLEAAGPSPFTDSSSRVE